MVTFIRFLASILFVTHVLSREIRNVTYYNPNLERSVTVSYCIDKPVPNGRVDGVQSFSSCFVGTTLFDLVDRQYNIADLRKLGFEAKVISEEFCPIDLEYEKCKKPNENEKLREIPCGQDSHHYKSYPMISYSALGTHELTHWGSVYIDNKNSLWIVAVRGTWYSSDWLSNFFYGYARSEYRNGKVHSGFLKSSNELYHSMRRALFKLEPNNSVMKNVSSTYLRPGHMLMCPSPKSNTTVVFSGHSLGGAKALDMALQYSIECETAPHRVIAILYHAPKVGDSEFIDSFKDKTVNFGWKDIVNMACGSDIIPYVGHWRDFRDPSMGSGTAEFTTILYKSYFWLSEYWYCYCILNVVFTLLFYGYMQHWVQTKISAWSLCYRPGIGFHLSTQNKLLPYVFVLCHCLLARALAIAMSHQTRERGSIAIEWEHFRNNTQESFWDAHFTPYPYWRLYTLIAHVGSQLQFVHEFVIILAPEVWQLWSTAAVCALVVYQTGESTLVIVCCAICVLLLNRFLHNAWLTCHDGFGWKEFLACGIWVLNFIVYAFVMDRKSEASEARLLFVHVHLLVTVVLYVTHNSGNVNNINDNDDDYNHDYFQSMSPELKWITIDQGWVSFALMTFIVTENIDPVHWILVAVAIGLLFFRYYLKPLSTDNTQLVGHVTTYCLGLSWFTGKNNIMRWIAAFACVVAWVGTFYVSPRSVRSFVDTMITDIRQFLKIKMKQMAL